MTTENTVNQSSYNLGEAAEVEKAFNDLDNDLDTFDQISSQMPSIIEAILDKE